MTQVKSLLLILALITTSSGCASFGRNKVVLYPIEKSDIQPMTKGVAYAPEKDGWFLSDLYMREVQNAKIQTVKKAT